MALEDLAPEDTDGGGGSGDAAAESQPTDRQYVQPTREEFEDCLRSTGLDWYVVPDARSKEIVYEHRDILPQEPHIKLRVFSTIDERSELARSKDSDAIRTVIWNDIVSRPVGGRTKTLRIKTYCKNLTEKIQSIVNETSEYVMRCDECGNYMVIREGKYGKFYGCSNYPECDHTEQLE